MQMLPVEVILAIALVDLPIDLDSKISVESQDSKGASWWYLACESDDHFVKVVDEIVSMCNYAQVRELCFMESHNGSSVIARATPKCQVILQKGLRFLGRFEFVGQSALLADPSRGIKIFDAIDFGPSQDPYEVSRRVILKCYSDETVFSVEVRIANYFWPRALRTILTSVSSNVDTHYERCFTRSRTVRRHGYFFCRREWRYHRRPSNAVHNCN